MVQKIMTTMGRQRGMIFMERQYQMFEEDTKWDTIQFRTDPV
jgi:hypothetical protein